MGARLRERERETATYWDVLCARVLDTMLTTGHK